MSLTQRLFALLLPKRWFAALEADSRRWKARCSCGHARSVWELGGVKYKAGGHERWFMRCPQCGQRSWHMVSRS